MFPGAACLQGGGSGSLRKEVGKYEIPGASVKGEGTLELVCLNQPWGWTGITELRVVGNHVTVPCVVIGLCPPCYLYDYLEWTCVMCRGLPWHLLNIPLMLEHF